MLNTNLNPSQPHTQHPPTHTTPHKPNTPRNHTSRITRLVALLLTFVLTTISLSPTTTLANTGGLGTGDYVNNTAFDKNKLPTVKEAYGNFSLVSFIPKSSAGTYIPYGSFIVASHQKGKDILSKRQALVFIDNDTDIGLPYSKNKLINDYKVPSEVIGNSNEPHSWRRVSKTPFVIVNDELPQVAINSKTKYAGKPEEAIKWAVQTVEGGNSKVYAWTKSIQSQLEQIEGFDTHFLHSEEFENGQFIVMVEPMFYIENAPFPNSSEKCDVLLTAAQLGLYDILKFKYLGGSQSPISSWDSTNAWSTKSPFINGNLAKNAFLTLDSLQSSDSDNISVDTGNVGKGDYPVVKTQKDWYNNYFKGNKQTPRLLIEQGGVWLASKIPPEPPEPNVAINLPKTDFQVETPEVTNFEEVQDGNFKLEVNIKGGYNPINEEYVWKYPEIVTSTKGLKVTSTKENLPNGKNLDIPDGEDRLFQADKRVATGKGTFEDLVKDAQSLTPEEREHFKKIADMPFAMSLADDYTIKALTSMSPDEFSKKNPNDGTVYYNGIIKIINDLLTKGQSEEEAKLTRKITANISGVVTDNPTYEQAELPPEKPISYEDFREDERLVLEVFVKTDMGGDVAYFKKHIADVAKDNGITDDSGFKEYKPMKLIKEGSMNGDSIVFDIPKDRVKDANHLVITARINWIDPAETYTHYYKNDEYLKRSETLPQNAPDALGWTNNLTQVTIEIPKPNLIALDIIPTINYDTEKLCIEATGQIEEIFTPTINTTHTVAIYKMTTKGYELVKEHTLPIINAKKGDIVKFNNGEPWCTGIEVPKNSTQKYYVTYYINKPHTQPDNESNYFDNTVSNFIDVSQGINWQARDILFNAKNKTPDSTESFTYDITLDGTGVLESLIQDGTTKISATHDIYISEDAGSNKTWTKVASSNTGKKSQGESTWLQAKLQPITVKANTSKTIYVKYCVNNPFLSPKKETNHNDNCVTNSLTLLGPNPSRQDLGFPSLSCTFTVGGHDTQFKAIPSGAFREVRPITEEWGRLTNIRYGGAENWAWRSCGICSGEWKDEKGEVVNTDTHVGTTHYGSNGIHDNIEQYWKGSVGYNTWYLSGSPPIQDKTDTLNKYQDKRTLDLTLQQQTVWYFTQRSVTVKDCHCKKCKCKNGCDCTSTGYYTVALSPNQEKEFVVRFDEEYTYNPKNSRTYSTEAKGTKHDKQITAGKGFQQTIRTRLITDYPGELTYTGATVHSVATGKGMHNKAPLRVTQLEPTAQETRAITIPIGVAYRRMQHDKMERFATFQLKRNPNSVGGIREAYTSVNYPDSYLTKANKDKPAPLPHLNDYIGLKTYSIINIENKTVHQTDGTTNGRPDNPARPNKYYPQNDYVPKFGICYKDNMIVLGNYHNDYWVKPIDRDKLPK